MYKYLLMVNRFYQRLILRGFRTAIIFLSLALTLWLTPSKTSIYSYLTFLFGFITPVMEYTRPKKILYKKERSFYDGLVVINGNIFFCLSVILTGNENSPLIYLFFVFMVTLAIEFNALTGAVSLIFEFPIILIRGASNLSPIFWSKIFMLNFSGITMLFLLFFLQKINEHREKKLWRLLTKDELTGLFNRSYLKSRILDGIKDRNPFALIISDINYFKYYNDHWGHPRGDILLIRIGKVLEKVVEKYGIAARFSGDEFIIFLPGADQNLVDNIIHELNQTLETLHFEGEECFPGHRLSLSLGSVVYPNQADSYDSLISWADQAMYQDKHSRNTT